MNTKQSLASFVRLKMNFVGFHTYPEVKDYPSGYQAEPFFRLLPLK
jgi:hypothetical protein